VKPAGILLTPGTRTTRRKRVSFSHDAKQGPGATRASSCRPQDPQQTSDSCPTLPGDESTSELEPADDGLLPGARSVKSGLVAGPGMCLDLAISTGQHVDISAQTKSMLLPTIATRWSPRLPARPVTMNRLSRP
jgi:hypothetical protein